MDSVWSRVSVGASLQISILIYIQNFDRVGLPSLSDFIMCDASDASIFFRYAFSFGLAGYPETTYLWGVVHHNLLTNSQTQ